MERRIIKIERKLGAGGTPTPEEAMAAASRLQLSLHRKLNDALAEFTSERLPQTSEEAAFARKYTQADGERDGEIMRRWCQHLGVRDEDPGARERLQKKFDDTAKKMGNISRSPQRAEFLRPFSAASTISTALSKTLPLTPAIAANLSLVRVFEALGKLP
ncbi:MAG: hypothetical protein IH935_00170, partial [Acidobacteria bacterium]|nr:hypothetical protein [Acidobacteriota bacterium]